MEYNTTDGEPRSELKESASVFKLDSDGKASSVNAFNLAGFIWRGKWTVLLMAFIAFATALIVASAISFLQFSKNYEYVVQLTFSGVESQTYPNGTPFSIADITAPAILNEIYKENKISDSGISYQEFADLISITPYAPNRQFILSSYNATFNKRKASLAELEEAQKNLNQKLREDARRAAVLRFRAIGDKLSQSEISSILAGIVAKWSTKAVEEKGVGETNIQRVDFTKIEEEKFRDFSGLDLLSALVVRFNSLNDYVVKLARLPGGHRAEDPDTGNGIDFLMDQMMDIWRSIKNYPVNWTLDEEKLSGVRNSDTGLYSNNSFTDSDHISSDLQFLDFINKKRALVEFNVKLLQAMPFGATVLDSEGGISALDISQRVNELKEIDLENLRTLIIEHSKGRWKRANTEYVKVKLGRLNRDLGLETRRAQILSEAQRAYNARMQNSVARSDFASGAGNNGSDAISPQLSGGFIDKLIELNERSGDREFREKLIENTIRHRTNAAKLSAQINQLDADLEKLQNNGSITQETTGVMDDGEITDRLKNLIVRINEYGRITNKIASRLQLAAAIDEVLSNSTEINGNSEAAIDLFSLSGEEAKKSDLSDINNYLRDRKIQSVELPTLIANLGKVAKSANNIHKLISEKTFGYDLSLFEPLSGVDLVERPIFSSRWIYMIIALTFAGFLVGMLFVVFRAIRAERKLPLN